MCFPWEEAQLCLLALRPFIRRDSKRGDEDFMEDGLLWGLLFHSVPALEKKHRRPLSVRPLLSRLASLASPGSLCVSVRKEAETTCFREERQKEILTEDICRASVHSRIRN